MTNLKGLNIVMVGASLEQNGGIATVEKLILENISEIEIQHITSHDEGTITHRILVFSRAASQLALLLFRGKVDLVHIHLSDGGSLLRKALIASIVRWFRKPVIVHAHGAEFHTTYFQLPHRLQRLLGIVFRQCSSFIVLSNTWKEFYMSQLGLKEKQMVVLPNPTKLPLEIPDRSQSPLVRFVFLGRVGARKGTFDLIKAFSKLSADAQAQAQLLIAGDGDLVQAKELVAQLEISDRVTLLGWIGAQQRETLLSDADVFVLPSYNEGLPMALLEAMGWGLPTIVTPVGGIPEVIQSEQNGLLINAGDVTRLTAAMQTLVDHPQQRLELGKAARSTASLYDIHVYCDRLSALYAALV
ncbi:glycosyl transferase, group 1 family protein [Synechococcus sp. PCC 7335]|uniref:glycosyltransferase family 4 protein n=1 Tax=Synechococcus sp. (strain ATCC 29403 / PCC 7335) TaxID=91464 RepID=UPI00017EC043|nr:glycosyltransferase family 4 protein [Synechococcus sp. PCC 7335]EDX84438.1 glycosyl transferase, group 1 family protein [Synechococcus sp. PCC 7335]